ncbi:hypothetical protein OAQ99_02600 [Candidatus Kapabacteria bacterium]|nr:hypothetical protein [Candidatus Kapabacteria bacterium]
MTEMLVVAMIWLGLMTPETSYTEAQAEMIYQNNVCNVNEVVDSPSLYSNAFSS